MKQRSKVIASSIATIAMCASLAVGGTFALFTSESEVNIAVTSGTVDVKAYADETTLNYTSSLGKPLAESSANIVRNVVKIDKIVPGDTITFDLVIENYSNVSVQYQTVLSIVDGVELFTGLQIEVDEKIYDGMTAYSNWTALAPIDGEKKEFDRIPVKITLPENAGNEYQSQTAEISFIVKAVQGNATVEQPASDENTLYVYNASDMKLFAHSVNKGNNFSGKTVMMMSDIDLNNEAWTPIGNSTNKFQGTFDGNGKTVSNLYAVKDSGYIGLFGYTSNGEVKNLNVHNATVQGSVCGVVAASPFTSDYTNIKLTGDIKVDGKYYTGGLVGRNAYGDIKDITIAANVGSYVKANSVENGTAYRTYVGGVIGFKGEGASVTENVVSNIDVIGTVCDIGGITGIAHYGNIFKNCVSTGTVTNLCTDLTDEDIREIGGIAGVWHNENGTSVTFNNCKFTGKLVAAEGVNLNNPHNDLVVAAYTTTSTGKLVIDKKTYQVVGDQATLQDALSQTDGRVVEFGADITGDITVTQAADVVVNVDGCGFDLAGVLTVDGKSATYTTAGLNINNVNFKADSISADACIRLGDGTNDTRYTCNVTVSGCTFDVSGAVGVKSYTGGDKNLTITGCTATIRAHSLVQAKGIDGVLVEKCNVYSKNGMNFNNSDNVTVKGCNVDVKGYAVRFGESSGGVGAVETYTITGCTLKSACEASDDAVIILRGTADYATLTIESTTIEGTTKITNTATDATVIGA